MAIERDKIIALERLRRIQAKTQRHNRIHDGARDDNANRIRAIEGCCGNCHNLFFSFSHVNGKEVTVLRCKAGLSPLDMYRNADIFTPPTCSSIARITPENE